MTRENKLALVLGFGLLLLAGILVSDYLSAGKRVNEDPLIAASSSQIPNSEILKPAVPLKLNRTPQGTQARQDQAPEPLRQITLGGPTPRTQTNTNQQAGRMSTADVDVYYVKSGETLSVISTRYYGAADHVDRIAKINNLGNPNQVKVGTRLILPRSFDRELASSTSAADGNPPKKTQTRRQTVKVRPGETLSDIAKRELGDGNKWRVLWKANKNVVPNPNRLSPGTVLQLPTN
jgi:nucleoid-associated protein YgaU